MVPAPVTVGASAEQAVDVVRAEADLLVVVAAQLDVVEHVEVAVGLAVLVQPDQRAGQLAARAVELIFAAAGSSAAKRGTRLQRYYRDVAMYQGHIAAQHLSTAGDLARVHFGLPDSLF